MLLHLYLPKDGALCREQQVDESDEQRQRNNLREKLQQIKRF